MTPPHFLVVCPHVNTRTIMKDIFEALILLILLCLLCVIWIVTYLLIMVGIVALPAIVGIWIIEAL